MSFLYKSFRFLTILSLLSIIGFSAHAKSPFQTREEEPDQYVKAGLVADKTTVQGGETLRVGLVFNIYPGWHVYWKNPGDSGTSPEINWTLPPGFSVSELEFPMPLKLPFGPLTNYGHENIVVFLQNLSIPKDVFQQPFTLNAKVNLLVCHDICVPETHDVSLLLNGNADDAKKSIDYAETLLPVHKDWSAKFYEEGENFVIEGQLDDPSLLSDVKKIILFPEDWGAVDNAADASFELTDNEFTIKQKRGERDLAEISSLPVVIGYIDATKQRKAFHFIANPDEKALASAAAPENTTPAEENFGLWQALLFALFGGLILNLMPCVFPVLSMKALSLVNLNSKEEKKARGYGISYTLGILASFSIIGGALLALKAGGEQIGWGFQLQNPVIIILLTYLVFIIGLNLSGLFEFSGRFANIGGKLAAQSGNRGAFFTGVLATLVATPCTAPFMGAAMGYALTQPTYVSMLVFLSLGLGLALPYLALCFIPALRSRLPKPGHWMETFRQFLAFPMFITTAWLIWVLSQQIAPFDILCVLIGLVAIVFFIWLLRVIPAKGFGKAVSVLLLVATGIFIVALPFLPKKHGFDINAFGVDTEQNWDNFSTNTLDDLLKKTDDPVFVNMTAAWCITCKVNDKIALSTDGAKALFKEKNIQYLKGDWTNQNPEITKYLNDFNRQGVPLYVYYGARNKETGERPKPIVLPQILTAGLVEDTITNNP
ncbi:MAG TPA: protein-disulfide reductase DsbD family protein [Alphaproteobacteria bacterium]|nr:protein-disulfide reductase DsbD family protein [Alphaproteobacteria bacterium]